MSVVLKQLFLVSFLLLAAGVPVYPNMSFHPARHDILIPPNPVTAAFLDFDQDGEQEVAVLTGGEYGVLSVIDVNTDWALETIFSSWCGSDPGDLAVLDLNQDSRSDLVVSLRGEGLIRSFLGEVDGQFGFLEELPAGSEPSLIRAADILGDDALEVLVTSGESLLVFEQCGRGRLAEVARFPLPGTPIDFETGDFNLDGFSDVLISFGTDGTFLYFSSGDGHIMSTDVIDDIFPSVEEISGLETADINCDGLLDILVFDVEGDRYDILWGDGNGGFLMASPYRCSTMTSATVAQVDGSGLLDIISFSDALGHVQIHFGVVCGIAVPDSPLDPESPPEPIGFGQGSPSYCFVQRGPPYRCGQQTMWAEVADFNLDGIPDLFAMNRLSGSLAVFRGKGNGLFHVAPSFPIGSREAGAKSVAVLDADEDGHDDVAVAYRREDGVAILLGDGDGHLEFYRSFAIGGEGTHSIDVGDLNADGHDDLAVRSVKSAEVSVLLGDGAGNFELVGEFPTDLGTHLVEIVDVDLDGHLDVVTPNSKAGSVTVLLGDGTGVLDPQDHIMVGEKPHSVVAVDIDNDGLPDLATANMGEDSVAILRNEGGGAFEMAGKISVGNGPISVCSGDFNGDGFEDLATANFEGFSMTVLLGDGTGSFERTQDDLLAGRGPHYAVSCDMDRDGHLDLVSPVTGMDGVAVFFGDGTGGFPRSEHFGVDDNPHSVAIGDFNEDLMPDIVTGNTLSSNVTLLINALRDISPPVGNGS